MKHFFTSITFILISLAAFTQAGTLDNSFGNLGKVLDTTYTGDRVKNLIQPDGKIVIGAGYGSYNKHGQTLRGGILSRYSPEGSLDFEFGDSGRAICNFGDTNFVKVISAIALQKDNKIIVAGQYNKSGDDRRTMVARFNTDGSLDKNFGSEGFTVIRLSQEDLVRDMALLSDDGIVVTGDITDGENDDNRSFIACFTPGGLLDKNFGDKGIAYIELDTAMDINAIAVTKENKIILGGQYYFFNKTILLRFDDKGSMDKNFGLNGVARISFPINTGLSTPSITDIAITNDNKIVTGGIINTNPDNSLLVSRFLENGMPDNEFGAKGYTITEYNGNAYVNTIALQKDGKLLAGGSYSAPKNAFFTLARYNQAGLLDSSFAENGIVNTEFYGYDAGTSLSIQDDGKIVFSGYGNSAVDITPRVCIARYNNDDKTQKQIIITKIKRWLQHHNGFTWNANSSISSYIVQRSYDGIHFSSVARINAGNSSNTYADPLPLSGNNYYRLQTTNTNGAVNYSNVLAVSYQQSVISISPNPAKNNLRIEGLSSSAKTKITVVDFSGHVAISQQLSANGNTAYNLNIASLTPGNYSLKVEINNTIITKQFIKQ